MKNLLALFLATLVWACSTSGSKESVVQDSTSMNDTLDVAAIPDDEPVATEHPDSYRDSDTSQLEITFDETAGLVFERMEPYYTVTILTQQYEAGADVTWYFDEDVSPIYFKESWSAEGNEGATEFFIQNNLVMCASNEDGPATEKWCRNTGGTRTTWGEFSGDVTKELLPADYGANIKAELTRYMDILKRILNEAEKTEEDETTFTLRIEKTNLIGEMEVKESTEVKIPKKVFEGLK